jgi:uncharacterized protein YuzB (UPF0349 family)
MSEEMQNLVEKVRTEFTNVDIDVDPCPEQLGIYSDKYSAIVNGAVIKGDTTHVLFERIKNAIGERAVATDKRR